MKIKSKILLFAVSAIFSASSIAATVNCSGTIDRAYVGNGGDVVIWPSWSDKYHKICNLNSDWNSISTETCKAWLSIAISAKVSHAKSRVQYSSESSCGDIPSYAAAPAPVYFMLDM